jgi:hypothetical protein
MKAWANSQRRDNMKIPEKHSTSFYVYEHLRNDIGTIFYVGKGVGNRSNVSSKRNQHWKRIVAKSGGFSVRITTKNLDEELAFLAEMERIDQLKKLGVNLCNMTDGGEGLSGYVVPDDVRQKLRKRMLGNKLTFGKKFSDLTKEKMSSVLIGNKRSLGRMHSQETKEKMSKAMLGKQKARVVCPHCLKEGGLGAMYRWHFDNCNHRK